MDFVNAKLVSMKTIVENASLVEMAANTVYQLLNVLLVQLAPFLNPTEAANVVQALSFKSLPEHCSVESALQVVQLVKVLMTIVLHAKAIMS